MSEEVKAWQTADGWLHKTAEDAAAHEAAVRESEEAARTTRSVLEAAGFALGDIIEGPTRWVLSESYGNYVAIELWGEERDFRRPRRHLKIKEFLASGWKNTGERDE